MFTIERRGRAVRLIAALALLAAAVAPRAGLAQAPGIDPQAEKLLQAATAFLAGQQRFSVDVRANYDAYQQSGQKVEFGEARRITVVRPDRLRAEVEESNGVRHLLLFDGANLTLSTPGSNVFAQIPKPGTIDAAVVFYVRDLAMRLPLAALLLTTAPQEIAHRTRSIAYVEKTSILGTPAHHLAGRTDSVDYQVWVADGPQPWMMRIVLTYPREAGQPQYRAQLSDWNLAPKVDDSTFSFAPPAGATRIAFLAEMPRATKALSRKTARPGAAVKPEGTPGATRATSPGERK
jgi:hypothetical protein